MPRADAGELSLALPAGEGEGALSSVGSSPALLAQILAASHSLGHFTPRAGCYCAPELTALPDTSRA